MQVKLTLSDLEQSYSDICYQYGRYPYDSINNKIVKCAENALISMGFDIFDVLNIKRSKYPVTKLYYEMSDVEYERFNKN